MFRSHKIIYTKKIFKRYNRLFHGRARKNICNGYTRYHYQCIKWKT